MLLGGGCHTSTGLGDNLSARVVRRWKRPAVRGLMLQRRRWRLQPGYCMIVTKDTPMPMSMMTMGAAPH
jgi:hypothetical protein